MGGLSRASFQIKENRKNQPTLALSIGNLYFSTPVVSDKYKQNAQKAAKIIKNIQLDAIAVSPLDLSAGYNFLKQLAEKNNLPLVSANLINSQTNDTCFPPYMIKEQDGLKIAMIGLSGKLLPQVTEKDIKQLKWEEALPEVIEKAKEQADFLIILSNLNNEENKKIAQAYPEINIIFTLPNNIQEQTTGTPLLVASSRYGKYLPRLEIKTKDLQNREKEGGWWHKRLIALKGNMPPDMEVEKIIKSKS